MISRSTQRCTLLAWLAMAFAQLLNRTGVSCNLDFRRGISMSRARLPIRCILFSTQSRSNIRLHSREWIDELECALVISTFECEEQFRFSNGFENFSTVTTDLYLLGDTSLYMRYTIFLCKFYVHSRDP